MTSSLRLPFDDDPGSLESRIDARDRAGRERAVDPRFNVALEASAGTGKTRVLVDRYVNLLRAGVDPANILAITFTRKAAAEMRERVLASLHAVADGGGIGAARWRELRDRTGDIAVSTIDAFCLSLLREFPLEADLDPGFSMADDTEVPRLVDESLDRALRVCRHAAREDEHIALVFAQLGDRRVRAGLTALLNRRLVAPKLLATYLAKGPRDLTLEVAVRRGAEALMAVFRSMPGGLEGFLDSGPLDPAFALLSVPLRQLAADATGGVALDPVAVQVVFARARAHFLTQEGVPRSRLAYSTSAFASKSDYQTHRDLVAAAGPALVAAHAAYRRDLNVLVSRGVWGLFRIALDEYRRTLEAHAVIDFSEALERTLVLLRQMEEFAQSRYRLEARYHHVLVDEFQDTSRAQWELVSLLVQSWGAGAGLAHAGPLQPSIFIVGDRKQSIYGFRDADVSVLSEASRHLEALRPDRDVRRSISRSFRAVPSLLSFVNDVCQDMEKVARHDGFQYTEADRFPIESTADPGASDALGLLVGDSPEDCAERTASEIARLLEEGATVRDRDTGVRRAIRPADIAVLFRTRDSHREFEGALERAGVSAYVYKGLGFFDADEIKDVLAVLWFLADPLSNLRAAAWMRSRFVRLSDEALRLLSPRLSEALLGAELPQAAARLDASDAEALATARAMAADWCGLVDRLPPSELLDRVLTESAYALETRGRHFAQARENLKKIRALVRRIQNRGYVTLGRLSAHLDRLAVGDEANAVIDAADAVSLMTVHAAKGLEFPVVFVVNLARGAGGPRPPIRVATLPPGTEADGQEASDRSGEANGQEASDGGNDVSVAVGDFRSEADDDDEAKTREETKRLAYVALTRARDRLYLGSVLKEGRMQPGRGSLAEVFPGSLLAAMTDGRASEAVVWTSSSGTTHTLRGGTAGGTKGRPAEAASSSSEQDFAPLEDRSPRRYSVASLLDASGGHEHVPTDGTASDRLVGTLVHRVLQRAGLVGGDGDAWLERLIHQVIRPDERLGVTSIDTLAHDVASVYRRLTERSDVRELYERGRPLHEVPFTLLVDGAVVRGVVDCLIPLEDGRVIVLEFKTGRPRGEHQAQAELYTAAARALFPDAVVESRLVYAGSAPRQSDRP